jgi:trk system potassium uptake protein TrkH
MSPPRPPRPGVDPWRGATERRRTLWRRLTPPQLFVASFAALVAAGTVGLRVLPGLTTGPRLGWTDALFTATSAACVTGLTVVDTATFFTGAGQAFILLLIQLGGLGMITFTTLIILALGRRLSLRHERLAASGAEVAPLVPVERLTRDVVLVTVGVEAVGALALWLLWGPRFGWAEAAWPALFHAVSAFCNAGFSTYSNSLIDFQQAPGTLLVVAALVLVGSTGFLTLEELGLRVGALRRRRRPPPLSLHSRLALATTAVLVAVGWALFALFEWDVTLRGLSGGDRLATSFFLSVTPRTAGFNVIDYAEATDSTNFLTILLMFVGGSPGSTAGGLKTTTVALLVLLAWDRFVGHATTDYHGRSVPASTIERAVGLTVMTFAVVTASIFVLTWTERAGGITAGGAAAASGSRFLSQMFEAVSAFSTVGLSMGATAVLSPVGKVLVTLLMFLGRVGPLTFAAALALAGSGARATYRYAYEDVVVG